MHAVIAVCLTFLAAATTPRPTVVGLLTLPLYVMFYAGLLYGVHFSDPRPRNAARSPQDGAARDVVVLRAVAVLYALGSVPLLVVRGVTIPRLVLVLVPVAILLAVPYLNRERDQRGGTDA